MKRAGLKEMSRSRKAKLGHFIIEFATPGIGHILKTAGCDFVFMRSDILTVNCPLTEETYHLVDSEHLALMKPTSYLINTARGPIVDQKALTVALQNSNIAGAGLDVFEVEPTDPDDPLFALDNVIVTPHALCWTDQCFAGIGAADVRAVLDVQQGKVPIGLVNRDVLNRDGFNAKLRGYAETFQVTDQE